MALKDFHRIYDDSICWRLVPEGVETENDGLERTKGKPVTVSRIWDTYGDAINRSAKNYNVPCELIIATICTESSGKQNAIRLEPGYVSDEKTPHKISVGLTQTLISTAREAMSMSFDRNWLLEPSNAIEAGTAYISKQFRVTKFDPPVVAAAYNAGRIVYQNGDKNRWKMRQFPIGTSEHCDRFIKFFNDAVYVLKQSSRRPVISISSLLEGTSPPRKLDQGTCSNNNSVSIAFGQNANKESLSQYALDVLTDLLKKSDLKSAMISSTSRTPADQARIMYNNLESYGVESQKKLYSNTGDKVIDVYAKTKAEGKGPNEIKAAMEQKIKDIGPSRVSNHCADPAKFIVFDVAPSSIKNKRAFEEAIKNDNRIIKYFFPPTDPGYHIELEANKS